MKPCIRYSYCLVCGAVLAAVFTVSTPAFPQPQESLTSQLKEKFSKTGVFFRADTPRSLRNADDAYLPIYLEVINGVEKAAHTTGSAVSRYVQRDPLKLQGVNIYVKPTGAQHKFTQEALLLGTSKEFSFDARTEGQPLVIQDRLRKTLEVPRQAVQSFLASHYLGGPFASADFWVSFRVVDWPNQDFYLARSPECRAASADSQLVSR